MSLVVTLQYYYIHLINPWKRKTRNFNDSPQILVSAAVIIKTNEEARSLRRHGSLVHLPNLLTPELEVPSSSLTQKGRRKGTTIILI